MESEVKLKRGRGADLRMIASSTKKGNGTMELVSVKLKSYKERKPERKEARGADQTNSRRGMPEIMIAVALIAIVTFIAFLKVLVSNGGQDNEPVRPKDNR